MSLFHTGRAGSGELPVEGRLGAFDGAIAWLNSEPLTPAVLRGRVVLVDFWTYTCINWLRTLPYVRAWAERYEDRGLVVVGVHTPEFPFEQNLDNVRRAVREMRIDYPVVIDNDYAIWRAFKNNYWPALFLVDARGRVRQHHFGEGNYDGSERAMQKLLAESGAARVDGLVTTEASGVEVAADWDNLRSPETYLGFDRTQNFASSGGVALERTRTYTAPTRVALNDWALAGDWAFSRQAAMLQGTRGRLVYRFHARDVHLVMGPPRFGAAVPFRVSIDGRPPGAARGTDLDDNGHGSVTEQRLYQLIRQPKPIVDRTFEIEFLAPGAEVYAFTFG
jgi:thiol-disulfide isomerase/thioredoxin